MEQIKKILAPTDLSELSEPGVRYALELAGTVGAEVTVGHGAIPVDIGARNPDPAHQEPDRACAPAGFCLRIPANYP